MVLNLGRVLKPLTTAVQKKIEEAEERKKFEQELRQKEQEEYRRQRLEAAGEIAKVKVKRDIDLAKQGKSSGGSKGVFHQLTGQEFFIKGGNSSKSSKKADTGSIFSGGLSDADRKLLGMKPAKKAHVPTKGSTKGKTIVIKL